MVKLLLEKGVELETKDKEYSRTPLSWAAGNGREAIVCELRKEAFLLDMISRIEYLLHVLSSAFPSTGNPQYI